MQHFTLHRAMPRDLIIANVKRFLEALTIEKSWRVSVEEHKENRSHPQNRYLNGVAYKLLSDATGYERDDISEYMCGQYFGWKDKRLPGKQTKKVPIRTTTSDENGKRDVLKKGHFADYVAFVQRFGAQHGVYIPDPNEIDKYHESN